MKKNLLLACGVLGLCATDGYAVNAINLSSVNGCYSIQCSPSSWYASRTPTSLGCATYTNICVYAGSPTPLGVASCSTCNSGYELEARNGAITACSDTGYTNDGDYPSTGSYQYTACVKNCTSSNCASTAWAALRTGYESRTYRACTATGTSGTCNASTQYRCAAGYYGSSTNGTSGCNPCPEWSGVYSNSARTTKVYGTSSAGATAITGCYVVPGIYYDVTGTFKTTGNCPYKN